MGHHGLPDADDLADHHDLLLPSVDDISKGAQVTFTDTSDVYGGGFIVEGDQIIGKLCRIKAKKDEGTAINLVAACASDITLSR